MSAWDPGPTTEQGDAAREAAAQAERARLAREAADRVELVELRARVGRRDVDAYPLLLTHLARVHNVTLDYVRDNPYAVIARRRVGVRFPDDDETLAEGGHEIAHILAEPCGGPEHAAFDHHEGVHTCLKCEVNAWRITLDRLLPFSRAAFERLRRALATYRATTPAPGAVKAQADRLMSDTTFAEHRQRRAMHDLRVERQCVAEAQIAVESAVAQRRSFRIHK
jgi:hypothetical protein